MSVLNICRGSSGRWRERETSARYNLFQHFFFFFHTNNMFTTLHTCNATVSSLCNPCNTNTVTLFSAFFLFFFIFHPPLPPEMLTFAMWVKKRHGTLLISRCSPLRDSRLHLPSQTTYNKTFSPTNSRLPPTSHRGSEREQTEKNHESGKCRGCRDVNGYVQGVH